MKKSLFLLTLAMVLVFGTIAHAAPAFEVHGGYILGSYEDPDGDNPAPGFVFGGSANLTDRLGLRAAYQTVKVEEYGDENCSSFEILGAYKVLATDSLAVSVLGGLKTVKDDTWVADEAGKGLAAGAEVVLPLGEIASVRGSFIFVPSLKFDDDADPKSANRIEVAGSFALPVLPVKAEAGYRRDSFTVNGDANKVGGFFLGVQASF